MASNNEIVKSEGSGPPLTPVSTNQHHPTSSSSVATTTIRSYLQPVTALDSESVDTIKSLLRITTELRRNTSQTSRIQRGSPGAGALGSTLAYIQPKVNKITDNLSEVFKKYDNFPGMYLVSTQFPVFCEVLNGNFNDGGNDPGYRERVHLLEKLMFVAGTLRGHLEMVLEQHAYWKAKLAGEKPPRLARRLNFNQAVDPAQANDDTYVIDAAANSCISQMQQKFLPTEHNCKVSVNLPEEVQAAMTLLWEEQKFTDIDFIISGQCIPAHKVVLASQSQYFECMLYGNMMEATMREITLEDVPVSAFRKMLQFAYTGALHMDNVPLQEILEVTSVADRFGFVSLKEALGDQLSQNHISLDTVLILLVHSDIYHLQQLHTHCLEFIKNKTHTTQVLRHASLLSLPEQSLIAMISRDTLVVPEIEVFKAVQRWKEHNNKSVEEIGELLKCVRLSEFSSAEQIFTEVEPTGLIESKTILSGVRVLCKPCIGEMRPRGKKEYNKNLFTCPTVAFDSTTRPFLHSSQQQLLLHMSPPQQCVADTIIEMGAVPQQYQMYGTTRGKRQHRYNTSPDTSSNNTMIVALDDLYIINYLNLKGYPSVSDMDQLQGKCFSYIVSVSKDKKSWLKLADYSNYACRGDQHLYFPKQAARYVRMDLRWRENPNYRLPLQFSACCLADTRKKFSFLPNGVIASQDELEVVTIPWSGMDGSDHNMCVAYFRQPYSTTYIKFNLECSENDVTSVDITVSVGLIECYSECGTDDSGSTVECSVGSGLQLGNLISGGLQSGGVGGGLQMSVACKSSEEVNQQIVDKNLKSKIKIEDMDDIPLNSPVIVEFKEKVISYVAVTVRKIHRKSHIESPTTNTISSLQQSPTSENTMCKSSSGFAQSAQAVPVAKPRSLPAISNTPVELQNLFQQLSTRALGVGIHQAAPVPSVSTAFLNAASPAHQFSSSSAVQTTQFCFSTAAPVPRLSSSTAAPTTQFGLSIAAPVQLTAAPTTLSTAALVPQFAFSTAAPVPQVNSCTAVDIAPLSFKITDVNLKLGSSMQ